jgi:hypothetical protein
MKLKSLKFVLPILLVLPSFVFAVWIYQRTPEGTEITSPITLYFKFDDWNSDVCNNDPICNISGRYWQFHLLDTNSNIFYGEIHSRTIQEATDSIDLPIGTEIYAILIQIFDKNQQSLPVIKYVESCSPYCFVITETSSPPPSGTIGNTQNWVSSNEILGYIGKLAEDIPNYIALMMGLPIAFWFIEKTIAFVRGNFRPVEKIKKE